MTATLTGQGMEASVPEAPQGVFRTGMALGRLVLGEPLGQGGSATVYAARDPALGREVAVKVMAAGSVSTAAALHEARMLARVKHPNVLTVHDVGEHQGQLFVVMERVDGGTLLARLQGGPLAWGEAQAWLRDVARGVAALHAHGLLHRDIKPANVLLHADGRASLGDLGLAAVPREDAPTALAGTPGFMAPELLAGAPATVASDVFALGVTLLRTLALGAHGTLPVWTPRPPAAPAGCPRAAWEIAWRCVAPAPEARPTSADRVLEQLDRAAMGPPRWLLGAAAVLAAGVLMWAAGTEWQRRTACDAVGAPWGAVFTAGRRAALRSAAGPDGERAVARAVEWGAAWEAVRKEACVDAVVARTHSRRRWEQQDQCLTGRLMDAEALLNLVAEPGGAREVMTALDRLDPPRTCAVVPAGTAAGQPPLAPAQQEAVARLHALHAAGRMEDVAERAAPLVEALEAKGAHAHLWDVHLRAGDALTDLGRFAEAQRHLRRALVHAAHAADALALGRAHLFQAALGVHQGAPETPELLAVADGHFSHAEVPVAARLERAFIGAEWWSQHGDQQKAVEALEGVRPLLGLPDARALRPLVLSSLAAALILQRRAVEAQDVAAEAVEAAEDTHGPTHPAVAAAIDALLAARLSTSSLADIEPMLERLKAVAAVHPGKRAGAARSEARVRVAQLDGTRARAALDQLAELEPTPTDAGRCTAETTRIMLAAWSTASCPRATALAGDAVSACRRAHGSSPTSLRAQVLAADLLLACGQVAPAAALLKPEQPSRAEWWSAHGAVVLEQGEATAASVALGKALEQPDAARRYPFWHCEHQVRLARAHHRLGQTAPRDAALRAAERLAAQSPGTEAMQGCLARAHAVVSQR